MSLTKVRYPEVKLAFRLHAVETRILTNLLMIKISVQKPYPAHSIVWHDTMFS